MIPARVKSPATDSRDPIQASPLAHQPELLQAFLRLYGVLRYTDVFLSAPGELSPELGRELLAHFTPAQLVELSAALALFMGFSKIAVALGGLPDEIPVHEQPTPTWPSPR